MKYFLSVEGVDVVAQLAWSRVLLAFDFDGTLAPIVGARDDARMRGRTQELFTRVCERYPCAVISGRSRADVIGRLGRARPAKVIGNHGLEPGPRLRVFEAEAAAALPGLARMLAGERGIELENKRYSLAVHYRGARQKRIARTRIHAAIALVAPTMRVIPGKLVVNIVPATAPDKGEALNFARDVTDSDTALYVGDDVTDEDVFCLDQPGRLVTVRVGRSSSSGAAYYLKNQREMDTLLQRLVSFRKEGGERVDETGQNRARAVR